jgi:hypothetical protein
MGLALPFLNSNPTWHPSEEWVSKRDSDTYYSLCEIHLKFFSDFPDTSHCNIDISKRVESEYVHTYWTSRPLLGGAYSAHTGRCYQNRSLELSPR